MVGIGVESNGSSAPRALHTGKGLGSSLTGNELWDDVLLALLLLLVMTLVRDIVSRAVYLQPRWRTSSEGLSYHAQARMAMFDNYSRRVWAPHELEVPTGQAYRYRQRNRRQYCLVVGAGLLLVLCELVLIVLALPADSLNREIRFDPQNIIGYRAARFASGTGVLQMTDYECSTTPLVEAPNVKSNVTWSWCHYKRIAGRQKRQQVSNSTRGKIQMRLSVSTFMGEKKDVATSVHMIVVDPAKSKDDEQRISMRVYLNSGNGTLRVEFQDSIQQLVSSFLRNTELTHTKTGLLVSLKRYEVREAKGKNRTIAVLDVNATGVVNKENMVWFDLLRILGGSIEFHASGSRLFHDAEGETWDSAERLDKLAVASYIGTFMSPLAALYFTLAVGIVSLATRFVLRDPPGLGWEVITAHGRLCLDKPLTGPDSYRHVTYAREGQSFYVGFGVPPGFTQVDSLRENDNLNATPFAESRHKLGVSELTTRRISTAGYWEYEDTVG